MECTPPGGVAPIHKARCKDAGLAMWENAASKAQERQRGRVRRPSRVLRVDLTLGSRSQEQSPGRGSWNFSDRTAGRAPASDMADLGWMPVSHVFP